MTVLKTMEHRDEELTKRIQLVNWPLRIKVKDTNATRPDLQR